MDEQNGNAAKRRYHWPWFVLAAVLLFLALAILWMRFEVKTVEQERNGTSPLPSGSAH